MTDFKERIYRQYYRARGHNLAPITIETFNARAPMFKKIIREYFPLEQSAAVLDLGCGHGAFIHFMRQAGYFNVRGVDCSPDQIELAKHLGIEAVAEGELFETLSSLPDASQDVIVAFDVIEHFRKDELLLLADEVFRVLRLGGRWIIHTPNGESPFVGAVLYGDVTHELAFTRGSITQVLRASGFTEINCLEDQPIAHGVKSGIRLTLWLILRAMLNLLLAVETGDRGKNRILTQNFLAVASKTEA